MVEWRCRESEEQSGRNALVVGVFSFVDEEEREDGRDYIS